MLTQEVIRNLGTNHKTTSSYHPQANGLVERMNHTLAAMLSMYVSQDHKDWDEALPYVCLHTTRRERNQQDILLFFGFMDVNLNHPSMWN
jgi:transposase InsO family protein